MNRTRSFHALVLVLLLVLGGATTGHAQRLAYPVWQITDEGPDDSTLTELVRMPDGDVVCAGMFPGPTGEELVVSRLDDTGHFEWVTRVANPYGNGSVDPRRMLRNPGPDEVVLLCRVTGGPTVSDFLFVSFDPDDGHVIADRLIDHFDYDLPGDMEIGPSSNIVMCGSGTDPDQYLVMKLDPAFQTLWEVNLGNPAQENQFPTDLALAANGDVLVSGLVSDGVQRDIRVDRLTQSGAVVYSKDFGDPAFDDWDAILYASAGGGTYFAFRKAAFDASAEARIYRLDQAGNVMWGMVDTDLAWVEIEEIDNDEFIIAGVGPFSLGAAQTFRKFDKLGNNLGTLPLLSLGYEHNWIRDMTIGPDDIIYTTAHATPTGGTGVDWFINALTIDGGLVYQWSLNSGDETYNWANGIAALGNGRIAVCGEIGDTNDNDAHIVTLQALLMRVPDAATVRTGQLVDGDVDSLARFDGDDYEVSRTSNRISSASAPVTVEIDATLPPLYPRGSLSLSFTSHASTLGLTQELELWNWPLGAWDRSTPSALTTANTTTVVTGSVTDHIDAATGRVRARCQVTSPSQIMSASWRIGIEQAAWLVQP